MSAPLLLLLLRLLSAALLLGFLALIAWFIYRDLKTTSAMLTYQGQTHGALRVIAPPDGRLPLGALYPLQPVTSIGRGEHNAIVLAEPYASGEHALLTWRGNQWWLEDLGSRNGTLLNDVPIVERTVIAAGDVISIGDTQLKLEL